MAEDSTRSRYVAIKTSLEAIPDPLSVVHRIVSEWPEAAIVWANHPAESGGHPHTHYMVRFPVQTSWGSLRKWLMNADPHSYSAVGRSWTRAVRYLLHLDNPEKDFIPRESLHWEGIPDEEVEIILGAPRRPLLKDILNPSAPKTPFGFVDWLVNERGHSPGEVASMLRCVLAASEYIARRAELEALQKARRSNRRLTLSASVRIPRRGFRPIPEAFPQVKIAPFLRGSGFRTVGRSALTCQAKKTF